MNLCCRIHPLGQCIHCRATFCWDHLQEQYVTPITKGRLSCTECKWFWTIYSYPLLPHKMPWAPDKVVYEEYDFWLHQAHTPGRQVLED